MKSRKTWNFISTIIVLSIVPIAMTVVSYWWDLRIFLCCCVLTSVSLLYALWRFFRLDRDIHKYLKALSKHLDPDNLSTMESTPLPIVLIEESGEIIWYNDLFRQSVLSEKDSFGLPIETIFPGLSVFQLAKQNHSTMASNGNSYALFTDTLTINDHENAHLIYCIDDTQWQYITAEYDASRPVVLSLYIDNGDEMMQNLRDSERAQLSSRVETLLEDWIAHHGGIFRKCSTDRFIAIVEYRFLQHMIENKFDILDRVRTVQTAKGEMITLSVGVGTAHSFSEAESYSRKALDMALGRGGDQVALKTDNGFEFYGGLSKSVEKQTRVRPRVVASALHELILNSDNVLLMGHRYSDLDCLGAAIGLTAACRSLGKTAYTVYDPQTTLATDLVTRFNQSEYCIIADDALPLVTSKTLLIITDTHIPTLLDVPELYQTVSSVVVIDHHRKMVGHIDNAVIFYHEPNASSASEMVAELIQYMPNVSIDKTHAEALLAGIMLDTRSFVMKAGVRTFEAAAYLRKLGADTVEVKRLFSENIDLYQQKAEIISTAQRYGDCAIAHSPSGGSSIRVAASQAADELLSVKGVHASFALFVENGGVNISARSFGLWNVQLVMEALGGGGHQTMAGAYLADTTLDEAILALKNVIDSQRSNVAQL